MINARYTLFSHIPLFKDPQGQFHTNQLWEKDLALHAGYLPRLNLCCPVLPLADLSNPADADTPVDCVTADQIIALAEGRGWRSALSNIIPNYRTTRRALQDCDIAHSSGVGWPFPLSYYVLMQRRRHAFQWVMVIESSDWMLPEGQRPNLRARIGETLHGRLIRACLRMADARIFTQAWYRDNLLGHDENCLIAPAIWLDAATIRAAKDLPPRLPGPLRVIFPSRLIPQKGVRTVMQALEIYQQEPDAPALQLDVMGEGLLAGALTEFIARRSATPSTVQLRLIPPLRYGAPFLSALRQYDAVLIASEKEEQPRIAFDAFSQGLPCIASRTHGNQSVIDAPHTGTFFAPGDAAELASTLAQCAADPDALAALRPKVLDRIAQNTHAQMHRTREAFLHQVLNLT